MEHDRWKSQCRLESVGVAAHVEEDTHAGQAKLQLPLDHGHLILSAPPDVTARREQADGVPRGGNRVIKARHNGAFER
eukprot:6191359-Pleurochrysis_carterae.AAC.16